MQIVNVFDNGELIDTPGFSSLDINLSKQAISLFIQTVQRARKVLQVQNLLSL
nr:hypothetical protein [Mycoplasmopsis bovis]